MCLSLACIVAGLLVSYWNPLNKKLWSVSFAFASAGVAGALLCVCFYVFDCNTLPNWTKVSKMY